MSADRLPHLVLFSGGTACRSTNLALCAKPVRLTRIVPAWDSGGSSKVIRESLDVLGVGDIRQALMTMAHGEGRAGDVVKVCNARLTSSSAEDANTEFALYAEGRSKQRAARLDQATLLKRSFDFDVFTCPGCGGRRRVLAVLKGPGVKEVLRHLGLPTVPLPLASARGPPHGE